MLSKTEIILGRRIIKLESEVKVLAKIIMDLVKEPYPKRLRVIANGGGRI